MVKAIVGANWGDEGKGKMTDMLAHPVGLRTWTPHSRSLRLVQHSKLNGRRIGDLSHCTTKRINLADNLSFCYTAHGRIARHSRHFCHIHCDEQRL